MPFDDRPDFRLDQYPVIRSFYRQNPHLGIDPTGKDLGALKKELRDRVIQTRNELTKKAVTEVKRKTANVE